MRKIVLIGSHFPNIRMEKEAKALASHAYTVTVIGWERWGAYSPLDANNSYGVKKFRLTVPPNSLKVALCLPIWWLFTMWQLLVERWDVVHAVDFDTFVPALLIAQIKRKPIVYDIADFYADTIGFPILPGLSRKIVAKIDRTLMRFAVAIVLPNESMIEQVGLDTTRKSAVIINNTPDPDILRGVASGKLEDKPFVIFYGGGIGPGRGITDMCLAVKDLPDVRLVITGPCSPDFEAELRETCKNITNVKLHLSFVPYKEVITETVRAHALFAIYDPADHNVRFASPNKLFEAMMCGKPIIVSDGTYMTNVVKKENCGLVVPYGDINEIREAILKLENSPEMAQGLGRNGRRAYENRYSWRIMEGRLLDIYQHICNRRKIGAILG
ncbi:MAG: glycosyltransferase family 4 protein [Dehalococcoidia bacterium]|nr:glycosyltransferase family 4 protein [Dehalococcoidia bacterium]